MAGGRGPQNVSAFKEREAKLLFPDGPSRLYCLIIAHTQDQKGSVISRDSRKFTSNLPCMKWGRNRGGGKSLLVVHLMAILNFRSIYKASIMLEILLRKLCKHLKGTLKGTSVKPNKESCNHFLCHSGQHLWLWTSKYIFLLSILFGWGFEAFSFGFYDSYQSPSWIKCT